MRAHAILLMAMFVSMPLSYAAEGRGAPPQAATMAGHDHAVMPGLRPAAWTAYPTLKIRMSGEQRDKMKVSVVPQNIVADGIEAYSNDLQDENGYRVLAMGMGGAQLDKPASGGFQMLTAREEQADMVHVASTVYYFGERGAKDPTAMFMQQKHELEIIPQPYPREHSRYRANEDWRFLVRFNGTPLAGQKVVLETQNGSRTEWLSDAQGVVTVHLPDDFKAEEEQAGGKHGRGMPGADFVLATGHMDGGKSYLTAFNGSYGKDAFDQRSMAMGLGFTLLGMLGAVPLLRQRKGTQKEAGDA